MMSPADVQVIASIVKEHNITENFELEYYDDSGIGYCIDLIYKTEISGRVATITIPVVGVENW